MKRDEIRPGLRVAWQPPAGKPIEAEVVRVPRHRDRLHVLVLLWLPGGQKIDRLVALERLQPCEQKGADAWTGKNAG